MNNTVTINPVVLQTPKVQARSSAPVLPRPQAEPAVPDVQQADKSIEAAEAKRYEAVRDAASNVADPYVVGDQSFSIYKDVNGQYITRFTSLRDGKVTYIPEPDLLNIGGGSKTTQSLDIKA